MKLDFWKSDLWRSEYVRIIGTTQDDTALFLQRVMCGFFYCLNSLKGISIPCQYSIIDLQHSWCAIQSAKMQEDKTHKRDKYLNANHLRNISILIWLKTVRPFLNDSMFYPLHQDVPKPFER